MGAPLYGFQSIMKWAKDAHAENYDFNPKNETYRSQVNDLEKWLKMEHRRPRQVKVNLPGLHGAVDTVVLTVFDFVTQLFSLLSDPRLNKLEHLVVNLADHFSKFESPNGLLAEVLSGSWYAHAWSVMLSGGIKNFLIPIILYIDKTVLNQSGKLSVHPVQMSLGIFTEVARRSPGFWRPLGYIANEEVFSLVQNEKRWGQTLKVDAYICC